MNTTWIQCSYCFDEIPPFEGVESPIGDGYYCPECWSSYLDYVEDAIDTYHKLMEMKEEK